MPKTAEERIAEIVHHLNQMENGVGKTQNQANLISDDKSDDPLTDEEGNPTEASSEDMAGHEERVARDESGVEKMSGSSLFGKWGDKMREAQVEAEQKKYNPKKAPGLGRFKK